MSGLICMRECLAARGSVRQVGSGEDEPPPEDVCRHLGRQADEEGCGMVAAGLG